MMRVRLPSFSNAQARFRNYFSGAALLPSLHDSVVNMLFPKGS